MPQTFAQVQTTVSASLPQLVGISTEVTDVEKAIQASLKAAQARDEIGPKELPSWDFEDVEGKGNCFYLAVIKQLQKIQHPFLMEVPDGTEPHDSLRLRIQGRDFEDKEWATDDQINTLVTIFDIMVAILDTRAPLGYEYRYNTASGISIKFDKKHLPPEKPLIKIACTGAHYLSIQREPAGFPATSIPLPPTAANLAGENKQSEPSAVEAKQQLEDKEDDNKDNDTNKAKPTADRNNLKLFADWLETYRIIMSLIYHYPTTDIKLTYSYLKHLLLLYTNNASFSLNEIENLDYQVSPIQCDIRNSYLRTADEGAILKLARNFIGNKLQIKPTCFILIDSDQFLISTKNYFDIIDIYDTQIDYSNLITQIQSSSHKIFLLLHHNDAKQLEVVSHIFSKIILRLLGLDDGCLQLVNKIFSNEQSESKQKPIECKDLAILARLRLQYEKEITSQNLELLNQFIRDEINIFMKFSDAKQILSDKAYNASASNIFRLYLKAYAIDPIQRNIGAFLTQVIKNTINWDEFRSKVQSLTPTSKELTVSLTNKINTTFSNLQKKLAIAYTLQVDGVLVFVAPYISKELHDNLNLYKSLGYSPEILTLFETLLRQYPTNPTEAIRELATLKHKNIPRQNLSNDPRDLLTKEKLEKCLSDAEDVRNVFNNFINLIENDGIANYIQIEVSAVKKIIIGLKILENPQQQNKLVLFRLTHEMQKAVINANDNNINDFIRNIQNIHDAILLYLSLFPLNDQISLSEIVKQRIDNVNCQGVFLCGYGMRGFSNVFESIQFILETNEPTSLQVSSQLYYELLNNANNLKCSPFQIQSTSDIQPKAKVIIIDTHPNNAVQQELFANSVINLLNEFYPQYKERLTEQKGKSRNWEIYRNKELTLIIDATLNVLGDKEINSILENAFLLIINGLLNLVFIQSLTKFAQLGMDKLSAGLICVFNDPSEPKWMQFNQQLSTHIKPVHKLIHDYFFCLFRYAYDEQVNYLKAINANTNKLYELITKELNQLPITRQNRALDITCNVDTSTCYIAFNYHSFFENLGMRQQFTDDDIATFNKDVIGELFIEIFKLKCIPLTRRQSIGFPTCNINDTDTSIRLTVGLEDDTTLVKYAKIIAFICYSLNRVKPEILLQQQLRKDYFKALIKIYALMSSFEFLGKLGEIDIDLSSAGGIVDIKKVYFGIEKCSIYAVLRTPDDNGFRKKFTENDIKIDFNGEVRSISELPKHIKPMLVVFLYNHMANISLRGIRSAPTDVEHLKIDNFRYIPNVLLPIVTYQSETHGLVTFSFDKDQAKLQIDMDGKEQLDGSQLFIHEDLLSAFASIPHLPSAIHKDYALPKVSGSSSYSAIDEDLYDAISAHERDGYTTFDELMPKQKQFFFPKIPYHHIEFVQTKPNAPIELCLESREVLLSGNGFAIYKKSENGGNIALTFNFWGIKSLVLAKMCKLLIAHHFSFKCETAPDAQYYYVIELSKFNNIRTQLSEVLNQLIPHIIKNSNETKEIIQEYLKHPNSPNGSEDPIKFYQPLLDRLNKELLNYTQDKLSYRSAKDILSENKAAPTEQKTDRKPLVETTPTSALSQTTQPRPKERQQPSFGLGLVPSDKNLSAQHTDVLRTNIRQLKSQISLLEKRNKQQEERINILELQIKSIYSALKKHNIISADTLSHEVSGTSSITATSESSASLSSSPGLLSAFETNQVVSAHYPAFPLLKQWLAIDPANLFFNSLDAIHDTKLLLANTEKENVTQLASYCRKLGEYYYLAACQQKADNQPTSAEAPSVQQAEDYFRSAITLEPTRENQVALIMFLYREHRLQDALSELKQFEAFSHSIQGNELTYGIGEKQFLEEYLQTELDNGGQIAISSDLLASYLKLLIYYQLNYKVELIHNELCFWQELEKNKHKNDPLFFSLLGHVYKMIGENEKSSECSKKVSILDPESAVPADYTWREKNAAIPVFLMEIADPNYTVALEPIEISKENLKKNTVRDIVSSGVTSSNSASLDSNQQSAPVAQDNIIDSHISSSSNSAILQNKIDQQLAQQLQQKEIARYLKLIEQMMQGKNSGFTYRRDFPVLEATLPNGNKIKLNEFKSNGDGNCGFYALGINREETVRLLIALTDDENSRQLLADEISNELISGSLGEATTEKAEELKAIYLASNSEDALGKLKSYCATKEMYLHYVENSLGKNGWLGYESALLIAQVKQYDLYVWNKSLTNSQTLELIKFYQSECPINTFHLLHTDCFTHFNLLAEVEKLNNTKDSPRSIISKLQPQRTTIKSDKWLSHIQKSIDESKLELGTAMDQGDCFFDSFAQALKEKNINLPGSNQPITCKDLRLMCNHYLADVSKSNLESWVKIAMNKDVLSGGHDYQTCLETIQYTQAEMEEMKQKKNLFSGISTWGRPNIEGRILCEALSNILDRNIQLHVIDIFVEKIDSQETFFTAHKLTDAKWVKGDIAAEEISYNDNNEKVIVHLLNYRSHYVPLIKNKQQLIQTNEYLPSILSSSRASLWSQTRQAKVSNNEKNPSQEQTASPAKP